MRTTTNESVIGIVLVVLLAASCRSVQEQSRHPVASSQQCPFEAKHDYRPLAEGTAHPDSVPYLVVFTGAEYVMAGSAKRLDREIWWIGAADRFDVFARDTAGLRPGLVWAGSRYPEFIWIPVQGDCLGQRYQRVHCTLKGGSVPAVILELINAATGSPLEMPAKVTIQDRDFTEKVATKPSASAVRLAIERAGTYSVEVRMMNSAVWRAEGIRVERGQCGLRTVRLKVWLQPPDPSADIE